MRISILKWVWHCPRGIFLSQFIRVAISVPYANDMLCGGRPIDSMQCIAVGIDSSAHTILWF